LLSPAPPTPTAAAVSSVGTSIYFPLLEYIMRKPKIDHTPKPYRLLKTDIAAKLSARSEGAITYQLLSDMGDVPDLFIAVTANEGGGLWSREAVSLTKIEEVLSEHDDEPFPTKALRRAVVGRSSNNPPFLCAVLKDLGLIAPAPDKAHQHVRTGDWAAFREEMLALPGEAVMYPPAPVPVDVITVAVSGGMDTPKPATARAGRGKRKKSDAPATAPESDGGGEGVEADEQAEEPP